MTLIKRNSTKRNLISLDLYRVHSRLSWESRLRVRTMPVKFLDDHDRFWSTVNDFNYENSWCLILIGQ